MIFRYFIFIISFFISSSSFGEDDRYVFGFYTDPIYGEVNTLIDINYSVRTAPVIGMTTASCAAAGSGEEVETLLGKHECRANAIDSAMSGKMPNPTGTPTGNKAIRDDGTLQTIATILGYTPYNATNPDGFITSSALSPYLSTAAAASTYQPIDADLTSIAAFSGTGLIYRSSANTYGGVAIGSGLQLSSGTLSATGGTGTVTSVSCGTGLSGGTITTSGTCSLPNTGTPATSYGVNSVTTDAQGRVTAVASESCNDSPGRSLNSNYTVSSTKPALLSYSVNASWSLNALLTGSGAAYLEYSTNAGSSWTTVNQVSKGLNLLTFAGSDDMNVVGKVPANALVRIRTASTNMTVSYVRGQECY